MATSRAQPSRRRMGFLSLPVDRQKIRERARSPFWCDVGLIVEFSAAALSAVREPSQWLLLAQSFLALVASVLAIVTVFHIRSDLQNTLQGTRVRRSGASPGHDFFLLLRVFPIAAFSDCKTQTRGCHRNGTCAARFAADLLTPHRASVVLANNDMCLTATIPTCPPTFGPAACPPAMRISGGRTHAGNGA